MLSDILQIIGEALFKIVGYFIGRLVIAVVSFGRWQCDPFLTVVPKREKRWCGLFHCCGDRVYFTWGGTTVIGLVVVLVVIYGLIWIWYRL